MCKKEFRESVIEDIIFTRVAIDRGESIRRTSTDSSTVSRVRSNDDTLSRIRRSRLLSVDVSVRFIKTKTTTRTMKRQEARGSKKKMHISRRCSPAIESNARAPRMLRLDGANMIATRSFITETPAGSTVLPNIFVFYLLLVDVLPRRAYICKSLWGRSAATK